MPLAKIESLQPSLLDTFTRIERCYTLPILLETLVSTMCWGWKEIIIPLFSSLASNNGFICSVNLSLFNDIWVLGFHGFDTKLNVIFKIVLSQSHILEQYHGSYEWIIMLEKYGRLDLIVFHLIWVIGTYDNWKNQNPGGRFGATS